MRIHLFLVSVFLVLMPIPVNASADKPPTKEEIIIESVDDNPIRQRSTLPTVLSFYSGSSVELLFNRNIGIAKISFYHINGTFISESTIDTNFQMNEYFSLPSGISQFLVVIEGENYLGCGERMQ